MSAPEPAPIPPAEARRRTVVTVPDDLLPAIRQLLAAHGHKPA